MIRIKFLTGANAGTELATVHEDGVRIGTSTDCEIVVTDSRVAAEQATLTRVVSGHYHLQIASHSDAITIKGVPLADFGSQLEYILRSGDEIGFGEVQMQLSHGRPRLLLAGGESAGREYPVSKKPISIGRAPDNSLVLDDGRASGHHAFVRCLPTGFVIEDQDSKNGTYVNGQRVEQRLLADCDAIDIGTSQLYFLIDAPEEELVDHAHHVSTAGVGDDEVLCHLSFISGPHKGQRLPMGEEPATLGTHDACTFVVSDPAVSNLHIQLSRISTADDFRYRLVVTSSGSQVRVNGIPCVGETVLTQGDLLEFGDSVAELGLATGTLTKRESIVSVMQSFVGDGTMADYLAKLAMPKFVIDGHIERSESITIGQSPACTILLEGDDIAPVHCTISYKSGTFTLTDQSRTGTYLGGKRVVEEELQTGHVLQIGNHVMSVTVRSAYCALETVDTATAIAAVEVARKTAFDLSSAQPDWKNSSFGESGKAYKTQAHQAVVDVDEVASMVRERKAELQKGAPAWRPSSDIAGDRLGAISFGVVTVVAVLVVAIMHTAKSDASLANHPLSVSHASVEFVAQADKLGHVNSCRACHTLGDGVRDDRCTACHTGFAGQLRTGHHQRMAGDGQSCTQCHTEHKGHIRTVSDQASTKSRGATTTASALGALDRCVDCHASQHASDFAAKGPVAIATGPIPDFFVSREKLHVSHAQVMADGEAVAIGCAGCHSAGEDGQQKMAAGLSCFRCHEGGDDYLRGGCEGCHRGEHQGAVFERLPAGSPGMAPAISVPSAGKSLLIAIGLALLAFFLPLTGIGVYRWRFRERIDTKMLEKLQAFPVELAKRLVHSINVEKCVGCQLCIKACPTNVLELVNHKSVVVNFDACIQCKRCEDACAFDALRMHEADKPPPMVTMPQVDANYMTPIDGLYLIGQAAGTPQIKNAANLGYAVVQHMRRRGVEPGAGPRAGADVDVIIVGSGPAGLAAALTCKSEGLSYLCLEKQRSYAWTVQNYYHKGKPVMAEPDHVSLVGPLPHFDGDREQILAAWQEAIETSALEIQYSKNVTNVKKVGDLFQVTVSDSQDNPVGTHTGARVILAIGTMGNPRRLGCPGDDLEKVSNALVDPDEFRDLDIVVVGGTDSAIEVALALCEHNRVTLSARSANFIRVKPRNLELIEKAFADGLVKPMFATIVREVTETQVTLEHKSDQRREELANDRVFAMIGGTPPVKWLQSIGVPYVDKPHSWSPPRTDQLARRHAR